jgi:hypothetical protein
MRKFISTLLLLLTACSLDVNGLEAPPAAPLVTDAGPIEERNPLLTDSAISRYGLDQNSAQLACQPLCADGCCDRAGVCHAGGTIQVCGQKGLACVNCGDGNRCNSAGFCSSEADN